MKRNIKLLGLLVISTLLVYSCKEDEIKFKKADPTGSFADANLKVDANYLDNTTHTLKEAVNLFNTKANSTLNFAIDQSTLHASKGAVTLASSSVDVKDPKTVIDLLKVDFSKIAPGLSDTITINATSDGIKLGNSTKLDVIITKDALPVLALDTNRTALLGLNENGKTVLHIKMDVFDKPLLEDAKLPLTVTSEDMVFGTEFSMDTVLYVKKDSVSWYFDLTVDGTLFGTFDQYTFTLDALEENIPSTSHFKILAKQNWSEFLIGKDYDWLRLNKTATIDALVEYKDTIGLKKLTLDVPVEEWMDGVTMQDYNIVLYLNEFNIQRGNQVEIPDTVLHLPKGAGTAKFDIYVDGSKFAAGTSKSLWIETDHLLPPNDTRVGLSGSSYWTTIKVGRKAKPTK